ncbi:MAG: hypothetical protein QF366_03610 [Candidatus Poseidoniia archaeon]|jgi:hypothetical protein|nr:hypothetical protein [Candidatus Poseidoniia archaeon]MDP6846707.1 hypothetical protein [Candidatus Poseidoniia archaeon]MDP7007303.1 hypothetical protein [Candidatus Poseidoniia archaeon]HIH79466.1 hypothetical protein [Candidatus Poseidoniia archaeon]|tara:strand:- start:359 stop:1081 length:723 start_codon:yes stop_codon:yes gene_type:complete
MNKIAIAVMVVGVLLVIGGVAIWLRSGDAVEDLESSSGEEYLLYRGADSEMELEGWNKYDNYLVVVMEGEYANGKSAIAEGRSANLTTADCELVRNFTLENTNGTNFFGTECVFDDDTEEDGKIHIGYICKEGCPDGTYTWNTNGTKIEVYDVEGIIDDFFAAIIGFIASFGVCCCGSIVLLVGIIMAFTMQEEDPNQWATAPGEDVSTPEPGTSWDDKESAWSEKKDYIRNDEKDGQNP